MQKLYILKMCWEMILKCFYDRILGVDTINQILFYFIYLFIFPPDESTASSKPL